MKERCAIVCLAAIASHACAYQRAEVPADLEPDLARLPLHYRFWWQGGGELDGYRLKNWRYSKPRSGARLQTKWVQFELRRTEDDRIAWLGVCNRGVRARQAPSAFVVCTYEPRTPDAEPMSLVLTASGRGVMAGRFRSGTEDFDLIGTRELTSLVQTPFWGTAGFRVRFADDDRDRASGFVSALDDTVQQAWLDPRVSVETRRTLAPLFLTFGVAWDPRGMNENPPPATEPPLGSSSPPEGGPFASHFAALDEPALRVAFARHLVERPIPAPVQPLPPAGPDLRPVRKPLTLDFAFLGLSLSSSVDSESARPDGADLGWSFGYPLLLGTTLHDFVHLQGSVEFGAVRPDVGSLTPDPQVPVVGEASSSAWRFAAGGRVTVCRIGVFRPFVGGEAVFLHSISRLEAGGSEVSTSSWALGGAPVWGIRWSADAGRVTMDLVTEGRLDVLDWNEPSRDGSPGPGFEAIAEQWLDRVEAPQSSIHLGASVQLVFRL